MKKILFAIGALVVVVAIGIAITTLRSGKHENTKNDHVKIGFMTTLSGKAGVIGKQQQNAVNLAMEHKGGQLGGIDAEIIFVDDQRKPDIAKQLTNRLIKRDRVDAIAGVIWSNVLMAVHKQVTRADTLLISANAGPSPLAGSECHPNFFSLSWQNDQTPEAMGKYIQDLGVESLYTLSPNYQAGKDMITGLKRHYKGEIVAEIYTKLGQTDFQAELSALRAARPDATFIFQPGGMGINFIKQWEQASMDDVSTLYTVFSVDAISLPALKDAAIGTFSTQTWSPDLDNAVNKRFVADYKAKFGGYPSFYAAQAYDSIMAIDHAIAKSGSTDTKAMRDVLAKGDIPTTRGSLAMNSNHFPIQNIYLRKVVKDSDGVVTTKITDTVFENHADIYAADCRFLEE